MKFLDAQVFVASYDYLNTEERDIALAFLKEHRGDLITGSNALAETFTALTRKRRSEGGERLPPLMTYERATGALQKIALLPVWAVTREIVLEAGRLRLEVDWGWFDLVNFATAKEAGCTAFVSRDKPGGRTSLEGIELINPFQSLSTR